MKSYAPAPCRAGAYSYLPTWNTGRLWQAVAFCAPLHYNQRNRKRSSPDILLITLIL